MTKLLRLLFLVLALPALLCAQSYTASIRGMVTDPSQAGVPGAKVVATDTQRNLEHATTTDSVGRYLLTALSPGTYTLTVEAAGFKKYSRSAFELLVDQQTQIDVTLAVGQITESIVVTGEAPVLESTTSSIGKVVDNRRILNLPLNTRNVFSLIFLTPGVAGSVGYNYGDMRYSVNGARVRMLDTLIDGVTAAHPTVNGGGGISVFPSVDAIEEYKVMGANYPAEFGRSQGSIVNVVFKSGANLFHGSAYEFLRNSVLDANNFFENRLGRPLASFKRSQFGGVLSGPIKRDKTFFMGDFEGLRSRGFSRTTFTVPTELERRGDFSRTFAANGQLIRIFDPFTTRQNPEFDPTRPVSATNSRFIRDQFPNNVIQATRFDPVALNVMKFYPLPNTPGNAITNQLNYANSGAGSLNADQFDVRIDHSISSTQKIFGRYSHRLIEDVPAILFPKDLAIADGRVNQQDRVRGAVLDYTNTVSPTTIVSARLGFARTLFVFDNQGLGFLPSSLGLPKDIDAAVDRQMFPRFSASGYVGLGGNDHRWNAFMTYTALANLTKIRGAHALKAGFEGRMIRVNVWEARDAGSFSFGAGFTQGRDPNTASSTAGNGLASLLVGTGSGNLIQAWKNVAAQSFYLAGYIQDDWRVTPKLTLNLGLRYDLDTPRTERYNRINYFDPFAPSPLARQVPQFPNLRGGLVFVGVDGNSRYQCIMDKNNFAPRLGLAYQLTPRTVIRAGYGHLFGLSSQSAQGTVGPFGFRTENPWIGSLDGITPFNLLRNPYPQGFRPPPGASEGLLTQTGANIQAVLQENPTPWSMQWNFTIQRELPSNILLEVAYVGTRGLQLSRNGEGGLDINQLDPAHMALGSTLNQLVPNPFFGIVDRGVFVSQQVSRAQLLRPYPQFTSIIPLFSSGSSSTYHALQATTNKRFSRGLQFEGSYTWAKSLDNGESHQNSYNVRDSRSLSDIDLAHRFVMSWVYELPFGRGRHFGGSASGVVNFLLGGWQVNGITTFQTGTPLGLSASNTAGLFNPTTRANNIGKSGKFSGPVHERLNAYFNNQPCPSATNPQATGVYCQPPAFTFGNVSPRLPDIRNDGVRNFDLSVFKEFAPLERVKVQFRAEFLNAFNTPRFGGPNTSVTSSSFGVISGQANAPRQIQFGLKLLW